MSEEGLGAPAKSDMSNGGRGNEFSIRGSGSYVEVDERRDPRRHEREKIYFVEATERIAMSDSDTESREARALFNLVRDRYGDRLGSEELEGVRKGVEAVVEAAEALRSVKLENSDEPFSVFKPYRKEE